MPRNRRKGKGAQAGATSNSDQNRPSQSQSSSSLSSLQSESVKHAANTSTSGSSKKQTRNRAVVVNERALSDSSTSPIFELGGPAKKEKSSLSVPASIPPSSHSKSSFWSRSTGGILKTPARKISDVGAAIKRKIKQNFAVSFLLDSSTPDDDLGCSKVPNGRHSKMADSSSSVDYYLPPSGLGMRPVPSANTLNRLERQDLVIWRRPIQTLKFFFLELGWLVYENTLKLWSNRRYVFLSLLLSIIAYFAYNLPGPHQMALHYFERKFLWCAYWVGLGVLSSVGLGTGLHTFLLYLGPHIASVTLAAYECHSLKFPEPPYPDQIICPMSGISNSPPNSSNYGQQEQPETHSGSLDDGTNTLTSLVATTAVVSLWQIMCKVALESFMWGAGTALGELPPYFMARAARLSGQEPDDDDYREYIQYMSATRPVEEEGFLSRGKIYVEKLVEYAGFWGILACASIPNPFFDLAGITCGHFLVPFATFFAATLIGKAIIKMTIQQVFIILAFSEHHMEVMVSRLKYIPIIGPKLQAPFKDYLSQQKTKLHRKPGDPISNKSSLIGKFFELIVFVMIGFFLVSLVNSLAQNYHRRQWQARRRELEAKLH